MFFKFFLKNIIFLLKSVGAADAAAIYDNLLISGALQCGCVK